MRADDTRIGEEHIKTPIPGHGVVDDSAHAVLVCGVEGTRVNLNIGVPLANLAPVGLEMLGVPVAYVQRPRPIFRVLVGGGSADAEGGVCACVICERANQIYAGDWVS